MPNKGKHLKTCPRIEEKNPELAAKALVEYAKTGSYRAAARATGLKDETVTRIAERNPEDFGQIKKGVGSRLYDISNRLMDTFDSEDAFTDIPPMNRMIMTGIAIQRANECVAREIPMGFDPQLARRVVEESEFWRNELQKRNLAEVTVTKETDDAKADDEKNEGEEKAGG